MMKMIVTIVWVALLSLATVFAQGKDYTWKQHELSFSVPKTHTLKHHTSDAFESGNKLTQMKLYPYADASETAQGMVEKVASQRGLTIETKGGYNKNGLKGYWVRANSVKYPTQKFWVVGFTDAEKLTNYYAVVWWQKGNREAYKMAYDMVYSFNNK